MSSTSLVDRLREARRALAARCRRRAQALEPIGVLGRRDAEEDERLHAQVARRADVIDERDRR